MTKLRHLSLNTRRTIAFSGAAALLLGKVAFAEGNGTPAPTILFICEHGYGKSLVAARHLERLAAAHGVRVRALARGADPGVRVPPEIAVGLARDGFEVGDFAPSRASVSEILEADEVVLIATSPDLAGRRGNVVRWDDISALSENYDRARGEIVAQLRDLLNRIQKGQQHDNRD